MSCFGGRLNEYKFLSIDRFDGINLSSDAFFLSHCHADHMVGLGEPAFSKKLQSSKKTHLYCSPVTKLLLLADDRFSHLEEYVYALELDHPHIIEVAEDSQQTDSVAVTLLPAAHCPGSVMFLFEGVEGNVLYTGDFRLPIGSGRRMGPLHYFNGQKKELESIYVDTTFCRHNAVFIPSREDCLMAMQNVMSDWLEKDRSNAVRLNLSAKYGYEYLFHKLYKRFNKKIYCRRKSQYRCLPSTYETLTENPDWARIFACFKKEKIGKPAHWKVFDDDVEVPQRLNFLTITLSTMYFTYQALPHQIYERISDRHYRFCYSFHSSYSEVCDFVKYLCPKHVFANVIPSEGLSLEQVAKELAIKCGIKSQQSCNNVANTDLTCVSLKTAFQKNSVSETKEPEKCHVTLAAQTARKRVLSFSDTDENSQEFWEKILEKARKRDDEINREFYRMHSKDANEIGKKANEFPSVLASPNSKAPSQSEIDALHVKMVCNEEVL